MVRGIAAAPDDDAAGDDDAADGDGDGEGAATPDDGHPRPLGQDTDAHGFALRESWTLELAALPRRAAVAVLVVTNFAGGGMGNVRRLQARVVDADAGDAAGMRDLAAFALPNARGAHANRSVAVLARVHREAVGARPRLTRAPRPAGVIPQQPQNIALHAGSAFALLRDGRAGTLEEHVGDAERVRETAAAVRDEHCAALAAERALAAAAEAEDDGEVRAAPVAITIEGLDLCVRALEDAVGCARRLPGSGGSTVRLRC